MEMKNNNRMLQFASADMCACVCVCVCVHVCVQLQIIPIQEPGVVLYETIQMEVIHVHNCANCDEIIGLILVTHCNDNCTVLSYQHYTWKSELFISEFP